MNYECLVWVETDKLFDKKPQIQRERIQEVEIEFPVDSYLQHKFSFFLSSILLWQDFVKCQLSNFR